MRQMHTNLALGLLATGCLATTAQAGTLVPNLDDATAFFSSTTTYDAAGTNEFAPTVANGMTLAARVTPNATDVSNSFTGAVNILEIGGTSNGSGILLVEGNYVFSTARSSNTAYPTAAIDTDGSDSGVGIVIGAATAGSQQDIVASLDNANAKLIVGLNGVFTSYDLTGVGAAWNWTGNDTISFGVDADFITSAGAGDRFGWRGGLSDDETAGVWFTNNAIEYTGDVALGQAFNAVAVVPEPASLALAGLGLALCARRRNRN